MANNSYKQLMDIASDPMFQNRIKYTMQKAAVDVMAEAAETAGHAERIIYAKSILDGSASVHEMAISFLQNATIAAGADASLYANGGYNLGDADFAFVINSYFNAMAGVAN